MKSYQKEVISLGNPKATNLLINFSNVMIFTEYLSTTFTKLNTSNQYFGALSSFFKYLQSNSSYYIDPAIFSLLKTKKPPKVVCELITEDELLSIFNELKQSATDYLGQLTWCFFYLLNTTCFRPNDILSLKRDCIVEDMKSNSFSIVSIASDRIPTIQAQTKVSNGKVIETNPSKYTLRVIEEAIKITEPLLSQGTKIPADIEQCIFIKLVRRNEIDAIDLDFMQRRFYRLLKKLNLDDKGYDLYSCRHTFMTKLFTQAAKENNLRKAIAAIPHTDINAFLKHYVHPDILNYLEALYHINISDVQLNGTIVRSLNETELTDYSDLNVITVKDNCGFCKGDCSSGKNIDCLICNHFIVTLDRIPYFEQSIKDLDAMILTETIPHEKQHLTSIKKLYVAYLAALYTLRNQGE